MLTAGQAAARGSGRGAGPMARCRGAVGGGRGVPHERRVHGGQQAEARRLPGLLRQVQRALSPPHENVCTPVPAPYSASSSFLRAVRQALSTGFCATAAVTTSACGSQRGIRSFGAGVTWGPIIWPPMTRTPPPTWMRICIGGNIRSGTTSATHGTLFEGWRCGFNIRSGCPALNASFRSVSVTSMHAKVTMRALYCSKHLIK